VIVDAARLDQAMKGTYAQVISELFLGTRAAAGMQNAYGWYGPDPQAVVPKCAYCKRQVETKAPRCDGCGAWREAS